MAAEVEQLPREFGKYHLIERIATGGMAELYRAKLYGAGGFQKDLAIKKVLPHLARDDMFTQMFMDEAMITVTLNHGNIAQVIDFGELNGEYFLVMEFVDGVDLQRLLRRCADRLDPVPPPVAAHITSEICRGLHYAHTKTDHQGRPLSIIHRDVSPQNVLLSFEGLVKLVDFGIARAASKISTTQAGVVKGKVSYMSPEQLTGLDVDHRSDVFSAGVILYEMVTNQRPFDGQTPQETIARASRGEYPNPQKLNREIDRKLAAIIKKALARNPRKRHQTARDLSAELTSYLHEIGQNPDAISVGHLINKQMPELKPRSGFPSDPGPFLQSTSGREKTPTRPPVVTSATFPAPADAARSPASGPVPHQSMSSGHEAISFGLLGLPSSYAVALESTAHVSEPAPAPTPAPTLLPESEPESEPESMPESTWGTASRPDLTPGECGPTADGPSGERPVLDFEDEAPRLPRRGRSTARLAGFGLVAAAALLVTGYLLFSPSRQVVESIPAPTTAAVQPVGPPAVNPSLPPPATESALPPEQKPPPAETPAPLAAQPAADQAQTAPPPAVAVKKLKRPRKLRFLGKQLSKPRKTREPDPNPVAKQKGPPGTLRINSEPFAVVFLGPKRIGPTPQMNISLPAGSHTLTLKNEVLGIAKRVRVHIESGKVHTVFIDLNKKR